MNIAEEIINNSKFNSVISNLFNKQTLNHKSINNNNLDFLRNYFRSIGANDSSYKDVYQKTANDFFLKYGLPNIIKNYYVLSELHLMGLLQNDINVVDYGCGPGTFSLANLFYKIQNPEKNNHTKIIMKDGVQEFFEIFEKFWNQITLDEKKLFSLDFCNENIKDLRSINEEKVDLVIFSNSLSEMLENSNFGLDDFVDKIYINKPIIVIIDYEYENNRYLLSNFAKSISKKYQNISLYDWPVKYNIFQSVNLFPINHELIINNKHSSNVKFLKSILIPKDKVINERPISSEIVVKYKEAWEMQDEYLLRDLFCHNATYIEKENEVIFSGMTEISRYWRNNAKVQKNIKFAPILIKETKHEIQCHWMSKFYRTDLNKWMILNGVFYARLKNKKILHFREIFQKKTTVEEPEFD